MPPWILSEPNHVLHAHYSCEAHKRELLQLGCPVDGRIPSGSHASQPSGRSCGALLRQRLERLHHVGEHDAPAIWAGRLGHRGRFDSTEHALCRRVPSSHHAVGRPAALAEGAVLVLCVPHGRRQQDASHGYAHDAKRHHGGAWVSVLPKLDHGNARLCLRAGSDVARHAPRVHACIQRCFFQDCQRMYCGMFLSSHSFHAVSSMLLPDHAWLPALTSSICWEL